MPAEKYGFRPTDGEFKNVRTFGEQVKPPERKLSGEWLDRATGLEDAALEGVHLLLPGHGDSGPTLEIFSYRNMEDGDPIMANHVGLTHIAFEVDDVDRTLDKALRNGGRLLGKVTEAKIKGAGIIKVVYFRDPEGNIVEIQSWNRQPSGT